jgi:hypothetical protein
VEYVAPLLQLLRKNILWKWSAEMQEAFVSLRDRFANTIHLVQPDEDQPYIINTDASVKAIGAVLMQCDQEGNTSIVSTASRVLTPTEQHYTTRMIQKVKAIFKLRGNRDREELAHCAVLTMPVEEFHHLQYSAPPSVEWQQRGRKHGRSFARLLHRRTWCSTVSLGRRS